MLGGVVGVALVIALGVGIRLAGNDPLAIDSWWHALMLSVRTDAGLAVARALEFIGGGFAMTVIVIAFAVAFVVVGRRWDAIALAVAVLASNAITGTLKLALARPRPADSLSTHAMTAFPSGHTSLAATVAIVLAFLIRSRVVWILAVAWIAVMAWSRTYLAAHWLTDVIGGAVLGASVAVLAGVTIAAVHEASDARSAVPGVRL